MLRLSTFGLILLLNACSGGDDAKPRTREEFCQEWAKKACSSAVVSACQATSAEACRLSQQAFCARLVPATFSDSAANACLTAVGDAYADADLTGAELKTVLELGPPCNRIVNGASTLGEACTTSREYATTHETELVAFIRGMDSAGKWISANLGEAASLVASAIRLEDIAMAREMLALRPDLPIIICTGFGDTITAESARAAGIREFVMKPLIGRELAEIVSRLLLPRPASSNAA